MDKIHHITLQVENIARAVAWYTSQFDCKLSYQDETWALLDFANVKLVLVIPSQHPHHVGIAHPNADKFGKLVQHRDGIASIYLKDSEGNAIEIIDEKTLPK